MSDETSSVARTLAWAIDQLRVASSTPRLDAELLLAHVLGWSRAHVLAEGRAPLADSDLTAFRALVARRAALEPVAYLLGHKEFYGLDFIVDRSVLVPRPETELLVDLALELARLRTTDHGPPTTDDRATKNREPRTENQQHSALSSDFTRSPAHLLTRSPDQESVVGRRSSVVIADIGTGSGCIAVAVAANLPGALVYAVDISPDALHVARQNVERHGLVDCVRLLQGDLLDPLPEPVDLLISNPPYTVLSEIDAGVRQHEPQLALDGGPDGLEVYRRLLAAAPARLRSGAAILLEIGATQGAALRELARAQFPAARVALHQDLAGLDRVVVIET
jgi:release factor glutamine methyltransferase